MQLRNGKRTTDPGRIKALEDSMVAAGYQTYANLRDLRCVFTPFNLSIANLSVTK